MGGWANSNRREELPPDWKHRVKLVWARAKGQCEWRSQAGTRCKRRGADVDHRVHPLNHDIDALQLLCRVHHGRKTGRESRAGRIAVVRKGERKRRDDRPGAL